MWGLDSNGNFKSQTAEGFVASIKKILDPTPTSVQSLIEADLDQVRRETRIERKKFEFTGMSDEEKRQRLMYLFQRDLMPGISQEVLDFKSKKDSPKPSPVSYSSKVIGWLVIFILNSSLLFYVYLFAMQESISSQGAWTSSFGIWIVNEIFLVSTLVCCVTHIIIPSFIMADTSKIRDKLMTIVRDFRSSPKDRSTDGSFNAAAYLFVSHRLALENPDLRESKIILRFDLGS